MGRKKAIKGSLSWLRAVVHYLIMKPFARDVCRSPRLWTQNSHLMIITGENGGLGFMYDVYIMKGSLNPKLYTESMFFFFFFFWNRLIITVLFSIRLIKKSRQQSLIDGEGTQNDNHRKKFLLSIVVFNWRNERNE